MEDESKSLDFILDNHYNIGQVHSFFIKCIDIYEDIIYGILDVEQGQAEDLDNHCDLCFNEVISWFRLSGDNVRCSVYLYGLVGLKKFNFFKDRNELNKILGKYVEIIDTII